MLPTQDENTRFHDALGDMPGDGLLSEEGRLTPDNAKGDTVKSLRFVFAGLVGGVIGVGVVYHHNLGSGGAELIPIAGAGTGVGTLVLIEKIRDGVRAAWDEFTHVTGW